MRRYSNREARFSPRALLTYSAANLPETLTVRAAAADQPTEIFLYDEIGFWGVNAADFADALRQAGPGPINLRINSPGGEVFDGLAIYNLIQQHPGDVNVTVDGLAASAASYIALAGKSLSMPTNSYLMIHNGWGIVVGDKSDMTDTAGLLAKIDTTIAGIYAAKTGKPAADMAALMDAETWFTGQEAKDIGLADTVTDAASQTQNALKPGTFAHQPSGTSDTLPPARAQADLAALRARQRVGRLAAATAA